jgi:peptide deformylase
MAIREILKFPDPLLRQPATPVMAFDGSLTTLVADLLDTMRAAPGVGITGPHIGEFLRVMVLELTPGDVQVYINPRIAWRSEDFQAHREGSVSMPGASEIIERPSSVRVSYQDVEGMGKVEEAGGFLAVCLQHEIDQLDGIFWTQRLSRLKREMLTKKWMKQQKR